MVIDALIKIQQGSSMKCFILCLQASVAHWQAQRSIEMYPLAVSISNLQTSHARLFQRAEKPFVALVKKNESRFRRTEFPTRQSCRFSRSRSVDHWRRKQKTADVIHQRMPKPHRRNVIFPRRQSSGSAICLFQFGLSSDLIS